MPFDANVLLLPFGNTTTGSLDEPAAQLGQPLRSLHLTPVLGRSQLGSSIACRGRVGRFRRLEPGRRHQQIAQIVTGHAPPRPAGRQRIEQDSVRRAGRIGKRPHERLEEYGRLLELCDRVGHRLGAVAGREYGPGILASPSFISSEGSLSAAPWKSRRRVARKPSASRTASSRCGPDATSARASARHSSWSQ